MSKNLDMAHRASGNWTLLRRFFAQLIALTCVYSLNTIASAQEDVDDVGGEGAVQIAFPGALPRMNRAQLEEYMYGSLGGSKVAFQKTKRESIRREIDRVNSICSLTDKQTSKLNEAIEVDIQHIETRINSLLSAYDSKMTQQSLQDMQTKVWQFVETLKSEKVDKKAVWHKVLVSQLTKEQREKIALDEERKVANQARTEKMRVLLSLQRKLGLNARQRAKIDEWLDKNEHREVNFQSICKSLAKSTIAAEVLRPDQIQSLESIPPKANLLRMNPNQILPALDDLFR